MRAAVLGLLGLLDLGCGRHDRIFHGGYRSDVLADAPLAYWPLDETTLEVPGRPVHDVAGRDACASAPCDLFVENDCMVPDVGRPTASPALGSSFHFDGICEQVGEFAR